MGGNPNQQQGPLENLGQLGVPNQLGGPLSNLTSAGNAPFANLLGGILGNLGSGGFMANAAQRQQPGAAVNPDSPATTQPTLLPQGNRPSFGFSLFSPQQQFSTANFGSNLMNNFGTLFNRPGTPTGNPR